MKEIKKMNEYDVELRIGNISHRLPHEGEPFEEDGILCYWRFGWDSIYGNKVIQIGSISPKMGHLVEIKKEKLAILHKWAYSLAQSQEEYRKILESSDYFAQYRLIKIAKIRRDKELAKQIRDTLCRDGLKTLAIETMTNPLSSRENRENLGAWMVCDLEITLKNILNK